MGASSLWPKIMETHVPLIYLHQWHRGPLVILKQTSVDFKIFLSKGERHVTMPVYNGFKFPPTDVSQ
jgi:hypothetical protein